MHVPVGPITSVFAACEKAAFGKFYRIDAYLFREIDFVCLIVLCMSCLCVKHMEEV